MKLSQLYSFATILATTLIIWLFISWPVPQHLTSGIPATAHNTEKNNIGDMIPGDHLQLLYHFHLAENMIAGKTPLFYNLYEFNTGNDKERYEPGSYYIPFSLIYTFFSWIGGRAFGWNITGFISLLLTLFFTWHLTRRYVPENLWASAISIISILLPYRWITLLGGSPTGFAMTLVPILLLGLDIAVRDKKWQGGLMAGIAVILAYCSDLHVFFFSVLVIPFWCILAFIISDKKTDESRFTNYLKIAIALIPTVILVLCAYLLSRTTAAELANASMADGWSLNEVAAYSPHAAELFDHSSSHIGALYIGYIISIIIAVGILLLVVQIKRNENNTLRKFTILSLLVIGIIGITLLALGTNGLFNGAALKICRKFIPPYKMIRQSAKIFCLMPSFLAVAAAISIAAIMQIKSDKVAIKKAGLIFICLLLIIEYGSTIHPRISLLDKQQEAYKAVVIDATEKDKTPLALVLPLWPGNSHWSSLYQYDASLYDLRLINGYRPAVPSGYFEDIFKRFESINQGIITDTQLDNLLSRGAEYILIHEDAFPEKVSPFPVSLTIMRLLKHPRLMLLKQDERVRAFKILTADNRKKTSTYKIPERELIFPSRLWYTNLKQDGTQEISTRAPVGNIQNLRWDILLKGKGTLSYTVLVDDNQVSSNNITSDKTNAWHSIGINTTNQFVTPTLILKRTAGNVNINLCVLNAGEKLNITTKESLSIPATSLFHGGYSDNQQHNLIFSKEREPARPILYGSLIMLPMGKYTLTLKFETTAQTGTILGTIRSLKRKEITAEQPVTSGNESILEFTQNDNMPVRIEFNYDTAADISISKFILNRKL